MIGLTESQVSSKNNPVGSFIEATLNYFADASEKPVMYTYGPSPGVPRTTGKSEAHLVLIRNARLTEELSLDWQGFQLIHQETAVRDFYDRVEVEKVYYPEIEALLKETTGAEKVVVFDHQVRNIELSLSPFGFRRPDQSARCSAARELSKSAPWSFGRLINRPSLLAQAVSANGRKAGACTGFHHTAPEAPRFTTFSQNRENDDGQKDRNGYWRGTGTGRSPGSPLRSGVRRGASSAQCG